MSSLNPRLYMACFALWFLLFIPLLKTRLAIGRRAVAAVTSKEGGKSKCRNYGGIHLLSVWEKHLFRNWSRKWQGTGSNICWGRVRSRLEGIQWSTLPKTDVKEGQKITGTATTIPRAPEEILIESVCRKKIEQVAECTVLVTNCSKWQQTSAAGQREAQKGLRERCRVTRDVRTRGLLFSRSNENVLVMKKGWL